MMEPMDIVLEGCGRDGAGAEACWGTGGALTLHLDGLEASLAEP